MFKIVQCEICGEDTSIYHASFSSDMLCFCPNCKERKVSRNKLVSLKNIVARLACLLF